MKKFFNNSFFKRFLILIILFTLYTFICAYSYANTLSSNISNSVFRLHVIANSDSNEDQNLKYLVRDELLKYMNSISKNSKSKEEVIKLANKNIDTLHNIAKKVINDNGFDYNVKINIGNFLFPTKNYGDISLPAGNYDALRVEIGEAKGQNWWCVMFPPLCFIDVTSGVVPDESKGIIKNNLSVEEYNLVSNTNSGDLKFKFKLLEIFNNIKLANNK